MQSNENIPGEYQQIEKNLYSGFKDMKDIILSSSLEVNEARECFFKPSGELTDLELNIDHYSGFRAKLLTSLSGEIKVEFL